MSTSLLFNLGLIRETVKWAFFFLVPGHFAQYSPTCAGSYCQRTPHKKYLAANETRRFRFFIRSPLENLSPRAGRKLSENDQRG